MTDLEKFIDLYASVGIDLSSKKLEGHGPSVTQGLVIGTEDYREDFNHFKIAVTWGAYTILCFDESGKFVQQNVEGYP